MNGVRMPRADFITALVLLAFGAAMLWGSLAMPRFENRNIMPYSVPGIVPGILACVNLILAAVLLVRSMIRGGYRLGAGACVRRLRTRRPGGSRSRSSCA